MEKGAQSFSNQQAPSNDYDDDKREEGQSTYTTTDQMLSISPDQYMLMEFQKDFQPVSIHPIKDADPDDISYTCCSSRSTCMCYNLELCQGYNPMLHRALSTGWRGLIYTMFYNQRTLYNVFKFLLVLFCLLVGLVLTVFNGAILLIKVENKTELKAAIGMFILSLLFIIYVAIDFFINLRFFVKKLCFKERNCLDLRRLNIRNATCQSFQWFPNSLLFFADIARQVLPELLLYPLVLFSLYFSLLSIKLKGEKKDKEIVFVTISLIASLSLLFIMVYFNRIIFALHSLYSIQQTQCKNLSIPLSKKVRLFVTQLGFFSYSLVQTVVQLLVLIKVTWIMESGKDWDLEIWLYMVYGYFVHILGMLMFFFLNFPVFQGFSIEFFLNASRRIVSNPSFSRELAQTTSNIEAEILPLDPQSAYPSFYKILLHPFINIYVLVFCFFYTGIQITISTLQCLFYQNAFSYFITAAIVIVNVQPLIITTIIMAIIAAILLSIAFAIAILIVLARFIGSGPDRL